MFVQFQQLLLAHIFIGLNNFKGDINNISRKLNEFEEYVTGELIIDVRFSGDFVYAEGGGLRRGVLVDKPTASVKLVLYHLLKDLTGVEKPWGALTGVKPLNPMTEQLKLGHDRYSSYEELKKKYAITQPKLDLLWDCANYQAPYLDADPDTYSLYVHIPFCISRCSYCSFPSDITGEGSGLCDDYLDALKKEIDMVAYLNAGRRCDTVYIGGGTPSVLSASQTVRLLDMISPFTCSACEVTFEGGRCDTLSYEKYTILKDKGVTRISLNPQTVHDETLKRILRPTTHAQFLESYEDALRAGIDDINTDLIIGLSGENRQMYEKSVDEMILLDPASITLHSLCKKRTSVIDISETKGNDEISPFLDSSRLKLNAHGYRPYYLYKQKYAVSSGENTGYCRDDRVCIYNIRMMGGTQSIYSAGANSTTKIYYPDIDHFESVYNVKNTDIYIRDIDEVIQKKLKNLKKAEQIAYEKER